MELSNTGNNRVIELTVDAMEHIQNLVNLHNQGKAPFLERLYQFCKYDLVRGDQAKYEFERNNEFIKNNVYNTLPKIESEDLKK